MLFIIFSYFAFKEDQNAHIFGQYFLYFVIIPRFWEANFNIFPLDEATNVLRSSALLQVTHQ